MKTKICNKCGEEKPVTSFYAKKRNVDGYNHICKKCQTGSDPKYSYRHSDDTGTEKKCKTCGEVLPLEKYGKIRTKVGEYYQSSCKKCKNAKQHIKRKVKYFYRVRELSRKYNLTLEDYKLMLEEANYRCKICGKVFDDSLRHCVDHDHLTGKVRGILCSNCNSGIGMLGDSIENLKSALKYLEEN